MRNSTFTIYFLLVLSMLLWGGTWVAGRILAGTMAPANAAFLRFLLASIFLMFLCVREQGGFPRLSLVQCLQTLALGATGVFLYSVFFFNGLRTISAGRAALIVACIPVCISALSALLFKERFGPLRVAGTILSLCGVAVVIADGNPLVLLSESIRTGDALILGCVASWTAYTLIGRRAMRELSPLAAVTWSCVFGALMLLPFALGSGLFSQAANASGLDWFCIAYLGILATGLAYYWYYRAVSVVGASRAGIFINLVPVFAVALGALLLGEVVHASLLAGGAMVVAGVWLTNRP